MIAKTAKWGHSLALRLPKTVAQECGIKENTVVDISAKEKKIIITPVKKEKYSLEKLLSGITKDNIHSEIDFGNTNRGHSFGSNKKLGLEIPRCKKKREHLQVGVNGNAPKAKNSPVITIITL